ncbi:MAG: hypothetical protein R3A13_02135 [Bdellovibrionota bacterium]
MALRQPAGPVIGYPFKFSATEIFNVKSYYHMKLSTNCVIKRVEHFLDVVAGS